MGRVMGRVVREEGAQQDDNSVCFFKRERDVSSVN